MTSAPAGLLEARRLLLDHLDMHPGQTVHADLDPAEVGIVGDPAHLGGYHCGRDRVRRDSVGNIVDYSVIESPRDRAGLDVDAAALDVGYFRVTTAGGWVDLYQFNAWLVGECVRQAPDTLDIREVIYSPDGVTVKRWDRLKRRTTGDGSHRTHTHISEFRDAGGRKMTALMRRWLIHIGLIEGDDMTKEEHEWLYNIMRAMFYGGSETAVGGCGPRVPVYNAAGAQVGTGNSVFNKLDYLIRRTESGEPPAPADIAAITTAMRGVLSEPAVLAAQADAVHDDAARRLEG